MGGKLHLAVNYKILVDAHHRQKVCNVGEYAYLYAL